MNIPYLDDVRLAYIERENLLAQAGNTERRSDDELNEEFDEWIEGIRAKAWLEGHSFRARVNPYKEKP